ncbi:EI24 domain-containing protein [Qipengyuania xiapuensis]|uniref:EI24 domain-containing protein n=2 Tax=Qipengyuania xiapuensis TaxID=2867236 RepID=A0ABX8ZRC0_9SPHN|nr:EI24 domain-containing protein [Qipengyuania xiapuensis]QZD91540.1 EI24 domain-containing protein [Qipengyuania xiapuensis]
MMTLPRALALSFSQLGDAAIIRVLVKSLFVTLAIFAVLGAALYFALGWLADYLGWTPVHGAGVLLTVIMLLIFGWLLFRFVALFVLNFYAEDVVRAVEAMHYPEEASAARSLPFSEELSKGLRSALRALGANLLALPFAIVLLFTGVGTALLFWAVNAWLLGRELQDMVWLRHRTGAHEIAPMGQGDRFMLGGAIAGLLMLPFVNLLAPVIGAASATHMVHRRRAVNA